MFPAGRAVSLKRFLVTFVEFTQAMVIHQLKILLLKDVKLELKQKYAINGILLYVLSTVFVSFLSFERILDSRTWNALFWIILLFSAVNAVSKSFVQEGQARQLYYYTIISPLALILSKIIYNILLMGIISLLCFLVFVIFLGNMVESMPLFLITILLGSWGFSGVLTMVSAIASRTSNNFALMAILSFPVVLPILLIVMKVTHEALRGGQFIDNWSPLAALFLLNLMIITLASVLFPYLWKD